MSKELPTRTGIWLYPVTSLVLGGKTLAIYIHIYDMGGQGKIAICGCRKSAAEVIANYTHLPRYGRVARLLQRQFVFAGLPIGSSGNHPIAVFAHDAEIEANLYCTRLIQRAIHGSTGCIEGGPDD